MSKKKLHFANLTTGHFTLALIFLAIIYALNRAAGLAGLGVVLIAGSVTVEANHRQIWRSYKKRYKPNGSWTDVFNRPYEIFRLINVYLLWPAMFVIGLLCLWAAANL